MGLSRAAWCAVGSPTPTSWAWELPRVRQPLLVVELDGIQSLNPEIETQIQQSEVCH